MSSTEQLLERIALALEQITKQLERLPAVPQPTLRNSKQSRALARQLSNQPREEESYRADARLSKKSPPVWGGLVWGAYVKAYTARYGNPPTRNAKQNSLCKQLVVRLGVTEAPLVTEFYVSHPDYANCGHSLTLLVRDAEKIRTEWAGGYVMTKARQKTNAEVVSDGLRDLYNRVERGEL